MTYAELNQKANQLAHFLIEQGIRPDTPVGICTERSIEMIVGQLGILKAGGVYVPIDADFPRPRIDFILRDTAPRLILTQQHLQAALSDSRMVSVQCLDSAAPPWHSYSTENPDLPQSSNQLAYIIYTSGSSGESKGVALTHQGVVRLVKGQDYAPFDPAQRYLALASPSFDAIIFELWGRCSTAVVASFFLTAGLKPIAWGISSAKRRSPAASSPPGFLIKSLITTRRLSLLYPRC